MKVQLNSEFVDEVDDVPEGFELMNEIVESIRKANPDVDFEVVKKDTEILMLVEGEAWFHLEVG